MKIANTKLQGVKLITPEVFRDHRGEYVETFNEKEYFSAGVRCKFVQDDVSVSKKGVLRGIHGDEKTWKLVQCLHGKFFLAVVNCDPYSSDFGESISLTLDDQKRQQVLIPPMFGNGHYVLSEKAIFSYKQSEYYDRMSQFSYRYDDKRFKIKWPFKGEPILSKRDKLGEYSWTL